MTRKDYEAIAEVIRAERGRVSEDQEWALDRLTERLADVFGRDNPRFDRDRFLRAAGVEVRE